MKYDVTIGGGALKNLDYLLLMLSSGISSLNIYNITIRQDLFVQLIDAIIASKIIHLAIVGITMIDDRSYASRYFYYNSMIRLLQNKQLVSIRITNDVQIQLLNDLMRQIVVNNIQKLRITCRLNADEYRILSRSRSLVSIESHIGLDPYITKLTMVMQTNRTRINVTRQKCLSILYCRSLTHNVYNISTYKDLLRMLAKYVWIRRFSG